METLRRILAPDHFMPHGFCYLWNPKVLWLHAVSDGVIFAAYLSIAFTLVYIARRRRDLHYRWMLWCFGAFIISCGFTHGMAVWTIWHPDYWIAGIIKAITAIASVTTAALLVNATPQLVEMANLGSATPVETFVHSRTAAFGPRRMLIAYGLAVVTTAVTLLLITAAGRSVAADTPVIVFLIPVALSAYLGGLFPGLFCTALGALASFYFLLPPANTWRVVGRVENERWVALVLTGALVSFLSESQHRSRVRVQEDDARLAGIIGSAMDAILAVDDRMRIALFNPAAEEMFACRAAEAIGRPVEQFIPALLDSAERLCASDWPKAHVVSTAGSGEILAQRSDGVAFPIEASIAQMEVAKKSQFTVVVRDVSERREAEAARSRLAAIVESSDDAIVGKALDGVITSWNRGAEWLYGYTPEEALGKPISIVIPPERRHELQEILETIQNGRPLVHLDTVRLRKDGTRVSVSVTTSPIRDRAGRVTGASSIARDITERKQAEEAMRENEAQFRTLANAIPQLCWMANADGWIFWYNQRWYEYTGTTARDMEGWGWQSVHDPDELPKVLAAWKGSIATGNPFDMIFPLRGADGVFRSFLTRVMPLRDSEGKVVRWFGTNTDISEQRRNEEALRLFVEHAPAAIAMLDEQFRYVLVSRRWLSDYRLSDRDVIGLCHYEVFPDMPERWREVHRRCLAGAVERCEEDPYPREDGTTDWLRWEVRPWLRADGKIGGIIILSEQITARKQAEEALARRTEELQRSNADLEQFAYVASHDLKEPLRAVAGCVQLLERRYKGQLDSPADEFIAHAIDGASRMQVMIDDLLAFSRVGTRGAKLQMVESSKALETALQNLALAIEESGATVSSHSLPAVRADAAQLASLFQNLIGNALKFRREVSPRIEVGARRAGGLWQFSVRDNGIGIAPEYFDRIFGVFQRLHTRREYPGTGIGLAICKKIVERHGGRIWVESVPGEGTTFRFTI